jgi:hypothetical protein
MKILKSQIDALARILAEKSNEVREQRIKEHKQKAEVIAEAKKWLEHINQMPKILVEELVTRDKDGVSLNAVIDALVDENKMFGKRKWISDFSDMILLKAMECENIQELKVALDISPEDID